MNETTSSDSVQSQEVDSVETSEQRESKKDSVAYDTYRRTLSEAKKFKSELAQIKAERDALQEAKLEAEGNKDALIESLRKQAEEARSQLKESKDKFAYRSVSEQISREAISQGCKDANVLMNLLSDEDYNSLEIGDDYSVNQDDLKRLIESSKKRYENIALFGKGSANVQSVVPQKGTNAAAVDRSKMSVEELSDAIAKLC